MTATLVPPSTQPTTQPTTPPTSTVDDRLDAIERRTARIAQLLDAYVEARPGALPGAGRPRRTGPLASAAALLRSEWVKLVSLRSSTTTLAAAAGALLVLGAIVSGVDGGLLAPAGDDGDGFGAGDPTATALMGTLLAPLITGVLGVLFITAEYATGTIRTTLTAVPARLPVLAAKAGVLLAVTLPAMVVASLVTFLTGQLVLGAGDAATASLGDAGVLRAVLGTAVYLTGVALMGLAVGTLLRSTAAAVSVVVGVVFLLPGLGGVLLPRSWRDDVLPYLPSEAAASFTSVAPAPELLGTAAGAGVFAAWVVVPLVLAAVALKRRPV